MGLSTFSYRHRIRRFFRACQFVTVAIAAMATLTPNLTLASPTANSRLERIRASGEMRVCIWPDYYGISFRNPKTLKLEGIDVDMARELGRELAVSVRFVDSSFATLIDDVRSDRCDVAMFGIGVTPQRAQHLRFTTPHLRSDVLAITTRDHPRIRHWNDIDQPGVVVAVAKGTYHEPLMRERLRHATLRVLDTPHAREQEVLSGRADVFMTDYPYSQRLLDQVDWARRIAPPAPFHVVSYAWAMQPGDDAWYERVEAFAQTIRRDGRLREAARRYRLEPIVADGP